MSQLTTEICVSTPVKKQGNSSIILQPNFITAELENRITENVINSTEVLGTINDSVDTAVNQAEQRIYSSTTRRIPYVGSTIYVETPENGGNDTNDGLTPETPLASIRLALNRIAADYYTPILYQEVLTELRILQVL